MGSSTWSRDAYADISSVRATKSVADNFTQTRARKAHDLLTPIGVDIRESRDSVAHPNSLAILVALDVTGSMGQIPENMIKHKLGPLMNTIIDNGIPDPQILFAAIGDHISDQYPLQVGQFESGTKELDACLEKIYIEQGGGGGGRESYPLAWYFAAMHTSIDCFEKRGEKGFIFTIGDEGFHKEMDVATLKSKVGYTGSEPLDAHALYDLACNSYHIFHIHVLEGSNGRDETAKTQWKNLIGERFLQLPDQNNVAELIATTVAMVHGIDIDVAMSSFDAKTKSAVSSALATVKDSLARKNSNSTGVLAI